jgi:hypothetical protein
MIPISSALSGGLLWSRISCTKQQYELKRKGEIVASLGKPGFWSSGFEAETQAGRWSFRRGGFCGTGATIVDSATNQTIATSKSAWGGRRTLIFTDGQTFQVHCSGWWRPTWSVLTETGQPVVTINARARTVDLPATTVAAGRLTLLIMFAWYCVLRAEEDAAAATLVAAVS